MLQTFLEWCDELGVWRSSRPQGANLLRRIVALSSEDDARGFLRWAAGFLKRDGAIKMRGARAIGQLERKLDKLEERHGPRSRAVGRF